MMKVFSGILLAVVSLLLLGMPVMAQTPTDQETLFMTFVPNVQFAPIYVALEKGYFSDAGIDLKIEHGDENVGVDLIAIGDRNFGLVSGEEVIKARANERPLVYVYEWFQKYPVGIVVSENGGVRTIADLKGKRVGIPGRFGASYNGLTALLSANGILETDIQLEPIGFDAPTQFCIGTVEAAVVYINNEPLQIQQRIDAGNCNNITSIKVFSVSDAVDMVSNGLVTNEQTIANNPDLVSRMVKAFNAGLQDVINNPAEAYLLSSKYVENLPLGDEFKSVLESGVQSQRDFLMSNPSRDEVESSRAEFMAELSSQFDADTIVQFRVLLNSIVLWDADHLGLSDKSSWEATEQVLLAINFSPSPIDLDKAFTNQFVPNAGDS